MADSGLIAFDWDGKKQEYVPRDEQDTFLHELRTRCEIEAGVTLGDIFRAVDADKAVKNFIACYSWCPVNEFHEEAKLPPSEPLEGDEKIIELRLEGFAEFHNEFTGRREKRKVVEGKPLRFESVWIHLTGVGENGENYSVFCTPPNDLAQIPVTLVNTCRFSLDFEELFDQPVETCYSLLEVLDAIYFDISFYGGPKQNKEFLEGLKEQIRQIDNGSEPR